MTTAKPQAKISSRFASRDPVAVVPRVAASQRCSATITAARIRGFRGIPCRTLTIGTEFFARIYFRRIRGGFAQSIGRRVLPAKGLQEGPIRVLIKREFIRLFELSGLPTGSGPGTERRRPRGGARRWYPPGRASRNALGRPSEWSACRLRGWQRWRVWLHFRRARRRR